MCFVVVGVGFCARMLVFCFLECYYVGVCTFHPVFDFLSFAYGVDTTAVEGSDFDLCCVWYVLWGGRGWLILPFLRLIAVVLLGEGRGVGVLRPLCACFCPFGLFVCS